MKLTINQTSRAYDGDPKKSLLWVLREDFGLTGAKFGCGIGVCGACTVLLGKSAVRSCVIPVGEVGEAPVTTIEGLGDPGPLHPLQQAWIEEQVPQCGYCQPGFIMAAAALLNEKPKPTDADIFNALTNVCRCGTHPRIQRAMRRAID